MFVGQPEGVVWSLSETDLRYERDFRGNLLGDPDRPRYLRNACRDIHRAQQLLHAWPA